MSHSGEPIRGVPWEELSLLLAALKTGSLSAAASYLGIGQSTASRRLSRLEENLGARLFERLSDGLKPTAFALELEGHAKLIEGHMADVERLAAGQEATPSGRLTVAMPDGLASHWLLPALPSFFEQYPDVEVDCVIGHGVVDLNRGAADIALRFIRPSSPELVCKRLAKIPIGAYVHPCLSEKAPQDLRWILLGNRDTDFPGKRWIANEIRPARTMHVSLWHALISAIGAKLGAGLISPVVAQPMGLLPVKIDVPENLSHELVMVYHRAMRSVPRVAAFRSWVTQQVDKLDAPLRPGGS